MAIVSDLLMSMCTNDYHGEPKAEPIENRMLPKALYVLRFESEFHRMESNAQLQQHSVSAISKQKTEKTTPLGVITS